MSYKTNCISEHKQNSQGSIPLINEKEEIPLSSAKVKSHSKSYFMPLGSQIDKDESSLLISGFQIEMINTEKEFDFYDEIFKINQNYSKKDRDKELAKRFHQYVNPKNIPDGHCASCAFCTHLHFVGHKLEEAKAPENFKKFGDWFYKIFFPRTEEKIIHSRKGEAYGAFKNRIERAIKDVTTSGEAVLISVSDGAHWFNGYNDGKRIWFIDSQKGRGFNLYSSKEMQSEDIICASETMNIIKVMPEDIFDYETSFENSQNN